MGQKLLSKLGLAEGACREKQFSGSGCSITKRFNQNHHLISEQISHMRRTFPDLPHQKELLTPFV